MAASSEIPPSLGRQLTSSGDDPGGNTAAGHPSTLGGVSGTSIGTGIGLAPSAPAGVFEARLGGLTDPGVPGKNNQDDFFVWDSGDGQNYILGVLDGHGRDLGALAANEAKRSLLETLTTNFSKLRTSPGEVLVAAFAAAHQAVKQSFKKFYESTGWTVTETADGYLTRMRAPGGPAICIHGGSTGTVVVVLDGRYLIVANVGDSSLLLCGSGGKVHMKPMTQWATLGPQAAIATSGSATVKAGAPSTALRYPVIGQRGEISIAPTDFAVQTPHPAACDELSEDHGPECASEFLRMRSFRPNPADKTRPALSFVYDTLTASKLNCPPIFEAHMDTSGKEIVTRTGRGTYYKNVRNEWATLVATPSTASYQDALAFTRSIGDLHLQTYGVSHTPSVSWMDLLSYEVTPPGTSSKVHATPQGPLVLCACSDGVWDNWKFEDVSQFLLHPGRVEFALKHETSQACCVDLMQANLERARVNFGNSADNMTAVLAYMIPRQSALTTGAIASGTGVAGEDGDTKLG